MKKRISMAIAVATASSNNGKCICTGYGRRCEHHNF